MLNAEYPAEPKRNMLNLMLELPVHTKERLDLHLVPEAKQEMAIVEIF